MMYVYVKFVNNFDVFLLLGGSELQEETVVSLLNSRVAIGGRYGQIEMKAILRTMERDNKV